MSDWSLPRAVTGAAVVAFVALWTAIGHGQLSPAPRHDDDDPGGAGCPRSIAGFAIRIRRARHGPRDDADRIRNSGGDTLPYVRGSIIVKFKDDATRERHQCGNRASRRRARRPFVVGRLRHRGDSVRRRSGKRRGRDARARRCRIRATALSQPRDGAPERHALRQPVELPRHRHGARVGHPAGRVFEHHRRRARQRHGLPNGHFPLQLDASHFG